MRHFPSHSHWICVLQKSCLETLAPDRLSGWHKSHYRFLLLVIHEGCMQERHQVLSASIYFGAHHYSPTLLIIIYYVFAIVQFWQAYKIITSKIGCVRNTIIMSLKKSCRFYTSFLLKASFDQSVYHNKVVICFRMWLRMIGVSL